MSIQSEIIDMVYKLRRQPDIDIERLPQIGQAYKDGKMPPLLGYDK